MSSMFNGIVKSLSEDDLRILFDDIKLFHQMGTLTPDGPLRRLSRIARDMSYTTDNMLKMVEDAILFEMASRWNEYVMSEDIASVEGWKLLAEKYPMCKLDVRIVRNDSELKLWDVMVTAGRTNGPPLGFFHSEDEAQKFIEDMGYILGNSNICQG